MSVTTVVATKYNNGVMIGCDSVVNWGRLSRFKGIHRLLKINDETVLAAYGDYADFQELRNLINQEYLDQLVDDNGFSMSPLSLFNRLQNKFYYWRTRLRPFNCHVIVGGIENGQPYLGAVSPLGVAYNGHFMGVGTFGEYMALPMLRRLHEGHSDGWKAITKEEAVSEMNKIFTNLSYRDCSAANLYDCAIVSYANQQSSVEIVQDNKVSTNFRMTADFSSGY